MDWTSDYCIANGIKTHYLRTGGDKPPVILLHGLIANGACWSSLARKLEKDYDIIMPDARGHGRSSAPEQDYSYDNLAADVMGLINSLGLVNPIIVGHSMGGMTAAVVASQNPKQLGGLVLVDPTFLTLERQLEVYQSDVKDQHREILKRSKEDFLAEMKIRHSQRSNDLLEWLVQARFQTSVHAFTILTPPNPDYKQLISNLGIPGLLIYGDQGSIVSSQMATHLAALNHRLKTLQIKKAGHGIPYDQLEPLSAAVRIFLDSVINRKF